MATASSRRARSGTREHHPLAQLRTRLGLSREALGAAAGLSPRTIYGIEAGCVQPQRATVRVLCLALGCEASHIVAPARSEEDARGA
jgi:DNA-binding XRE family transcriptional regulator